MLYESNPYQKIKMAFMSTVTNQVFKLLAIEITQSHYHLLTVEPVIAQVIYF
jgi:hypothetical protein